MLPNLPECVQWQVPPRDRAPALRGFTIFPDRNGSPPVQRFALRFVSIVKLPLMRTFVTADNKGLEGQTYPRPRVRSRCRVRGFPRAEVRTSVRLVFFKESRSMVRSYW